MLRGPTPPRAVIALTTLALLAVTVGSSYAEDASSATVRTLVASSPAWAAAAEPLEVGDIAQAPLDAPLPDHIGLRPGVRMVSPGTCTMNFIFRSANRLAIGTAAHCLYDRKGVLVDKPVVVLTLDPNRPHGAPVLVRLGPVLFMTDPFHDGVYADYVDDFALIEIPARLYDWVSPTVSHVGGPCGTWDKQDDGGYHVTRWFGHGYRTSVADQTGAPRVGTWSPSKEQRKLRAARWTGVASGGDSGAPVVVEDGRALSIATGASAAEDTVPYGYLPSVIGPRMDRVLKLVDGWQLVDSPLCPSSSGGHDVEPDERFTEEAHDRVQGEFSTTAAPAVGMAVTIDAVSRSDGSEAGGTFTARTTRSTGGGTYSGQITCLSAVGRDATVAGRVTASTAPSVPVGSAFAALVQDRIRPGDSHDDLDRARLLPVLPVAPTCPVVLSHSNPFWSLLVFTPIVGDVHVHDAL